MNYDFLGTCQKFYHDFQEFVFTNDVVLAAAGFSVGIATKEVIERLLEEIVRPLIMVMYETHAVHSAYHILTKVVPVQVLSTLGMVAWSVFEWMTIIILTFLMLEYFLNRNIIGLRSTVKTREQHEFVKSKVEAKASIIPTKREVKHLKEQEKLEDKAGHKIMEMEETKLKKTAKQAPMAMDHEEDNYVFGIGAFDKAELFSYYSPDENVFS